MKKEQIKEIIAEYPAIWVVWIAKKARLSKVRTHHYLLLLLKEWTITKTGSTPNVHYYHLDALHNKVAQIAKGYLRDQDASQSIPRLIQFWTIHEIKHLITILGIQKYRELLIQYRSTFDAKTQSLCNLRFGLYLPVHQSDGNPWQSAISAERTL